MKKIIIISLLFMVCNDFGLCQSNMALVKITVILPDTVCRESRDTPIVLKVENLTSDSITIRDPAYWGNTFPICKNKKGIDVGPKVRVYLGVAKYLIKLGKHEIKNLSFGWTLNDLFKFDYCPSDEYYISFVYCYGTPQKDKKGRIIYERSVNSNVCSFYLK